MALMFFLSNGALCKQPPENFNGFDVCGLWQKAMALDLKKPVEDSQFTGLLVLRNPDAINYALRIRFKKSNGFYNTYYKGAEVDRILIKPYFSGLWGSEKESDRI